MRSLKLNESTSLVSHLATHFIPARLATLAAIYSFLPTPTLLSLSLSLALSLIFCSGMRCRRLFVNVCVCVCMYICINMCVRYPHIHMNEEAYTQIQTALTVCNICRHF